MPGTTFAINGFLVAPTADTGFVRTFTNNGTITRKQWQAAASISSAPAPGPVNITRVRESRALPGAPLFSVDFDSVGGVNLSGAANNLITVRVDLFTGNVTGSAKITRTRCTAVQVQESCKSATRPTPRKQARSMPRLHSTWVREDRSIIYLRTTTSYTTGGEINPARTLTTMTVDNNVTSLNIARRKHYRHRCNDADQRVRLYRKR